MLAGLHVHNVPMHGCEHSKSICSEPNLMRIAGALGADSKSTSGPLTILRKKFAVVVFVDRPRIAPTRMGCLVTPQIV
jgi:hypothetical protein